MCGIMVACTAVLASALGLVLLPPRPGVVSVAARPRQAVRTIAPTMGASPEGPRGFGPPSTAGKRPKQKSAPSTAGKRKRPQQKPTPSTAGKRPQQKPKAMVDRFEMQFTCNLCGERNEHSISRRAYTKGTVIVTCPGCSATHLVADNLNWIEDDFVNLEEYMAKQGTPITRIANDGVAAAAAAAAAPPPAEEPEEESAAPATSNLDGISDEQALRIRDAVRRNKKRNRQD